MKNSEVYTIIDCQHLTTKPNTWVEEAIALMSQVSSSCFLVVSYYDDQTITPDTMNKHLIVRYIYDRKA